MVLGVVFCVEKKEGKEKGWEDGGIGKGKGVRLRERFLWGVGFGRSESFCYVCRVNVKGVRLWEDWIREEEN